MKTRWRQHEFILISVVAVLQIMVFVWQMFQLSDEQRAATFLQDVVTGSSQPSWKHALLPGIGQVLLFYACYVLINTVLLRSIRRLLPKDRNRLLLKTVTVLVLEVILLSWLLCLGVNSLSYFGQPHILNYEGYQLLALLGYNDKPLSDLFFGFERAIALVGLVLLFTLLREIAITYIERPGVKRSYSILIANTVTGLLLVYFLLPFIWSAIRQDHDNDLFVLYHSHFIPVLLLYIYNTYWLFPSKGNAPFFSSRILKQLLIASLIATIPFALIMPPGDFPLEFLMYWAIQLFIITPITWMLYQQRKDKILELRGVEKELVKSQTDLQFLRSQINPHFLFNTLNTLYGTALIEKSERTAEGIQKLGDMMRFMLHENNLDFIPLARDVEYLKNYISLQKLRTQSSSNIFIEEKIDEKGYKHSIAPMLLIPFVENAFKHGISLKDKSWIYIDLVCDETGIHFEVKNSVHQQTANDPERDHTGIGIQNVRQRLALLYPGAHDLNISETEKEFAVTLFIRIPAKNS
jgi:two-component system, LytTR family, sensor kinase